jgi:hypothetical protein
LTRQVADGQAKTIFQVKHRLGWVQTIPIGQLATDDTVLFRIQHDDDFRQPYHEIHIQHVAPRLLVALA